MVCSSGKAIDWTQHQTQIRLPCRQGLVIPVLEDVAEHQTGDDDSGDLDGYHDGSLASEAPSTTF